MTTLTMAQRRADFEAMLKRADLARRAVSKSWTTEEGTPGKPLASLARDVAELAASWAAAAKRAEEGHPPSDQVKNLATLVAARCLQAITANEEEVCGLTLDDLLKAIADDAADILAKDPDVALDLGIDPRMRVQSLLRSLGDLAACWPIADDRPSPFGTDTHEQQFIALFGLLFEAICAALAAERGLWQEEES